MINVTNSFRARLLQAVHSVIASFGIEIGKHLCRMKIDFKKVDENTTQIDRRIAQHCKRKIYAEAIKCGLN